MKMWRFLFGDCVAKRLHLKKTHEEIMQLKLYCVFLHKSSSHPIFRRHAHVIFPVVKYAWIFNPSFRYRLHFTSDLTRRFSESMAESPKKSHQFLLLTLFFLPSIYHIIIYVLDQFQLQESQLFVLLNTEWWCKKKDCTSYRIWIHWSLKGKPSNLPIRFLESLKIYYHRNP